MKFNIEIDLDYIREDGSLDDTIRQQIIDNVVSSTKKKVNENLDEIVLKAAQKKADDMCNEMIVDFLDKKFDQTDQWGDEVRTNVSVRDILKKSFDEFWNEGVDENGRTSSGYSYGSKHKRFQWMIDQRIKEHSEQFAKTLTRDTENKIKSNMKKTLADKIGNKLVKEFGFDKLLLEQK